MSAAKWDERYRRGELLDRPPSPWLIRGLLLRNAPGSALDVACGPGRHALHLARIGWRVTALDAAPSAIEYLESQAARLRVPIDARVADLETHPALIQAGAFDLVADFFYLQRDLFPYMTAALTPGGLLVAEIPMVDDRPGVPPMNPSFLLQAGELPGLLAGLDLIDYQEFESDDQSASGRQRKVARAVARKLGQ
ncbi:MAG: class I SAM-dependent methyltransferase [Bryobacteraceae bacterium]